VDSLLEFKVFFFLKEVQENFLSFLSSGSDGSTGHLLSRDGREPKQFGTVVGLVGFEHREMVPDTISPSTISPSPFPLLGWLQDPASGGRRLA
jgi:hypothetical protein